MPQAVATSVRSSRWRVPARCEVCRSWSAEGALCSGCVSRYAAPLLRCGCCGLRLGTSAPRCVVCLRDPPPFAHTVCVADYAYPWDRLVAALKFHGRAELAAPLAARMVAAVAHARESDPDRPALPQLVVPVPLAPRRLVERGYNQAWELARRCAAALRRPADAALLQRPIAATADQTELDRTGRLRALEGAFMVDPRRRDALRDRHVALVDDVMTTGATVRAAAAALRRAGARTVDVWVLARTPAD